MYLSFSTLNGLPHGVNEVFGSQTIYLVSTPYRPDLSLYGNKIEDGVVLRYNAMSPFSFDSYLTAVKIPNA